MSKCLLMIACLLLAPVGAARAETMAQDHPTILQPAEGAVVASPVTIVVSPHGPSAQGSGEAASTVANPMDKQTMLMPGGAHLHLLIDTALPKPGDRIPMDTHHIHLLNGKTQVTVPLAPGKHTLQLVMGSKDHHAKDGLDVSAPVTITVK